MKIKFIISLSLFLIILQIKSFSQITASGTATAEIVELASLTSSTINQFSFKESNSIQELLSMGEIKIDSGANVECNVILRSANSEEDSDGNLKIEPSLVNGSGNISIKGSKVISISGNTSAKKRINPGLYKSSYSVTIAFN